MNPEVSRCMYGIGISMISTGILLLVYVIFFKDDRRKQDWYYIGVTGREAFKRRFVNFLICLGWLIGMVFSVIGIYLSRLDPYPTQSEMMFVGVTFSYLAMFVRRIKILFEKYKTWEEYQREKVSEIH